MRVQNKQLVSQILAQSSDSKGMEKKLMQIDRRMQSKLPSPFLQANPRHVTQIATPGIEGSF